MSDGSVISIFSPAGGQGVTFVACQLASLLREFGQCCLVDLNKDFGAINFYLNSPLIQPPAEDGHQACRPISNDEFQAIRSGEATLYSCAWKYNDSFFVVGAPPIAVAVESMGSSYVETVLESCRNEFYCTILDLPHSLRAEEVVTAMKLSDLVVVLGDLTAARTLCKFARLIRDDEFATVAPKVVYVLNHAWEPAFSIIRLLALPDWLRQVSVMRLGKAKLADEQIEILHELPHDRKSVRWALNQGEMVPNFTPLSQELKTLANKIHKRLTSPP